MSTYTCSACNFSSKTKNNIKNHIKNIEICNDATLIEHIVKLPCDICNKEFDTEYFLKNHKKICVEKKAIVIEKFNDMSEVLKSMSDLTNLYKSFSNDIKDQVKEIKNEIKEIKNSVSNLNDRVTLLEIKGKQKERKLEQIVNNDDEIIYCDYSSTKTFVPVNFTQIKRIFKENKKALETNVDVNIKGQRENVYSGNIEDKEGIEVDGIMYFYPEFKKRGTKSTNELKIVYSVFCENEAELKDVNTCCCYCKKHVDEE